MRKVAVNQIIESLLKTGAFYKQCETICDRFDIPMLNYPKLVTLKKMGATKFLMYKYLKTEEGASGYSPLNRCIELMEGQTELLCFACVMLYQHNKQHEAKGVFVRQNLTAKDFEKAYQFTSNKDNHSGIGKQLE